VHEQPACSTAVNLGEYFIKIYGRGLQHGFNFTPFYTAY